MFSPLRVNVNASVTKDDVVVNEVNFNEMSSDMQVIDRSENVRNEFVLPIVRTLHDLASNMC